jgi:hypothetical protein
MTSLSPISKGNDCPGSESKGATAPGASPRRGGLSPPANAPTSEERPRCGRLPCLPKPRPPKPQRFGCETA